MTMMVPANTVGLAEVRPMVARFSEEQRTLILKTCCGGASESEAAVLVAIAEARGLNPLTGECYFVKRWDKERGQVWAVQASIDSFRIKAEETGDYAGQDEPTFEYNDKGEVVSAKVAVYRRSVPGRPFAVGVARWDEYVQTTKEGKPTRFWANMPHNQLAKCAEALALRKAFPKVLAKVYTPEEMQQASNGGAEQERPAEPAKSEAPTNTPTLRYFMAQIGKAKDGPALAQVAHEIREAFNAGQLNEKQREKLKERFSAQTKKIADAERPAEDPTRGDTGDEREAGYDEESGHE